MRNYFNVSKGMVGMKFEKISALLLVFFVILLATGCSSTPVTPLKVGCKYKRANKMPIKKRSSNIKKILIGGMVVYAISMIPHGLEIVNTVGDLLLKNKEIKNKKE